MIRVQHTSLIIFRLHSKLAMRSSNLEPLNAFVKVSVSWSSPLQYSSWTSPLCSASHTKLYLISMCFVLLCFTGFFPIAIDYLLSHKIGMHSSNFVPNSSMSLCNQIAWFVAAHTAIYLVSAIDWATVCFLLDYQQNIADPRLKA